MPDIHLRIGKNLHSTSDAGEKYKTPYWVMKDLIGSKLYVRNHSLSFELLINTNTTSDLNPPLRLFSLLHSKWNNRLMRTFLMDLFLTQSLFFYQSSQGQSETPKWNPLASWIKDSISIKIARLFQVLVINKWKESQACAVAKRCYTLTFSRTWREKGKFGSRK